MTAAVPSKFCESAIRGQNLEPVIPAKRRRAPNVPTCYLKRKVTPYPINLAC